MVLSDSKAESRPNKRVRIFVVDDEHAVATTLALVLKGEGFDAIPFTQPIEALKAARSEPPDLLLSDVVMPRLSGIELAIGVLEHCPGCEILLFSGMPESTDLLTSRHNSGRLFELLPKPMHPRELLGRIRFAIENRARASSELDRQAPPPEYPPQLAPEGGPAGS